MAKTVARGKALVAKFRATPGVRDPEALAAYCGRVKKYRKSGLSAKAAMKAASKPSKDGGKKNGKPESSKKPSVLDDDPFNEDYGDDEKTPEEIEQEKYEAKLLKDMEKEERSKVHSLVHEAGGLKTRPELREEYSEIPNTFKRKDGIPGDEMADYFATYYPELGIEDERDLIDYLAS